jgi:hypothetical protein
MKATRLLLIVALAACGGASRSSASNGSSLSELDGGILTEADGGACDCKGMALPNYCMRCSDGSEDCAHFACTQGQCGIDICE